MQWGVLFDKLTPFLQWDVHAMFMLSDTQFSGMFKIQEFMRSWLCLHLCIEHPTELRHRLDFLTLNRNASFSFSFNIIMSEEEKKALPFGVWFRFSPSMLPKGGNIESSRTSFPFSSSFWLIPLQDYWSRYGSCQGKESVFMGVRRVDYLLSEKGILSQVSAFVCVQFFSWCFADCGCNTIQTFLEISLIEYNRMYFCEATYRIGATVL